MNAATFIQTIRQAQADGQTEVRARLTSPVRGVVAVAIRNLQGVRNGNKHDLWIESISGSRVIGRAYLGSRNQTVHLDGWPEAIAYFN